MSDITPFDFEAFDKADRQYRRERLEALSTDALALSVNVEDRTQLLLQQARHLLERVASTSVASQTSLEEQL